MKNYLFSAGLVLIGLTANAQGVGIGTVNPAASSILELSSTNKGFLTARMTTQNRTAIASPATGLQVYDTTTNTFWYYNGTAWINSGSAAGDNLGNHSATQPLVLNDFELQLRGAGDSNHKLAYSSTVNGPVLTGFGGGILNTFDSSTSTVKNVLTWKNSGNVGIGTLNPDTTLHVANNKTDFGETAQLIVTGASDPAKKLVMGYNTSADKGFIQAVHSGVVWSDLLLQPSSGNVGIGTTSAGSKLEVNGASTNKNAYNAGSSTSIDYSQSNLAYTTANPGSFTLQNIKDGGTYTLSVRGTTSGTAAFTASGFTVKYANNRATTAGTETLYTFIVMGSTVYVYTATGF